MSTVTIHQAKTNLSRLIAEVLAGGDVVIARGRDPVVRLVPVTPIEAPKRVFGRLKGLVSIDEQFFEPLSDEELALWNGEGD